MPMRMALICHSFHRNCAAALRSWNLAAGLASTGAQVMVFCLEGDAAGGRPGAPNIAVRVVGGSGRRTLAERLDSKLPRICRRTGGWWLAVMIFRLMVWSKKHCRATNALVRALEDLHRESPVDCMLTVWPTFEPLWATLRMAEKHQIPFVVEHQDPWRYFFADEMRRGVRPVLRRMMRDARFLVNVCDRWCRDDEQDLGVRSVNIPTGYWPAKLPERKPTTRDAPLTIAYTGHLWYFDINPLIEGMVRLRKRGKDCRFRYAGTESARVKQRFGESGAGDMVDVEGVVSPEEAYAIQGASDVLLLFALPIKPSTFGYKFAEVVSHGLPVLMVGKRDVDVLEVAERFVRVLPCETAEAVGAALERLWDERPIACTPSPEVSRYAWDRLGKRLLEQIEQSVLGGGRSLEREGGMRSGASVPSQI